MRCASSLILMVSRCSRKEPAYLPKRGERIQLQKSGVNRAKAWVSGLIVIILTRWYYPQVSWRRKIKVSWRSTFYWKIRKGQGSRGKQIPCQWIIFFYLSSIAVTKNAKKVHVSFPMGNLWNLARRAWKKDFLHFDRFSFDLTLPFFSTQGFFEFQDDVRFEIENWAYCDGDNNRVFKSELENGLKPAGMVLGYVTSDICLTS